MLSEPKCREAEERKKRRPHDRADEAAVWRAPLTASGPREPDEVPTETPEELPPGGPEELPPDTPVEVPPGGPEELPPDTPTEVPPGIPPDTPHYGTATRRDSLTVLLVEDDTLIRQSTTDMLLDLGHRVVEAGRAEEGLAALGEQAVDLLLCDVSLPDLSGVELARRARQLRPELVVVFATGHTEIDGLAESGLAQSSLLLAKPFEQEGLSACLAEARAAQGGGS